MNRNNEDLNSIRLTPEQLRQAGELLYGTQWQTDLARSLGIDARRIRDWLQERRPIPEGIFPEIIRLLNLNSKNTAIYADGLNQLLETEKNKEK